MAVRDLRGSRLLWLVVGAHSCLALACTRPNPAFDDLTVGLGSETSSSTTEPTGETSSSTTVSETTGPSETETTGPTEETDTGEEETETETTEEATTDEPLCELPEFYADCDAIADKPWLALGVGCVGDGFETIPVQNPQLDAPDTGSWRIATVFGEAGGQNYAGKLWAPRDGNYAPGGEGQPEVAPNTSSAMLMLSTGILPAPDGSGTVLLEPGSQALSGGNLNPDGPGAPEPINPGLGSNGGLGGTPFEDCAIGLDCSDSLYESWVLNQYNGFVDKISLQFTVEPPETAHGFLLDVAFFSAEYPEFIDQGLFADTLVVWASSDTFTGNLAFVDGQPLTATSLFEAGGLDYEGVSPALDGTGFEGNGASSWMLIVGPAEPFEPVQLTIFLTDLGDAARASVALVDNFRWRCGGCEPGECGLKL